MKLKLLPSVSPFLMAGVLMILLPIFTFMTLDRLERQKEFATQRLREKGVSLIRTFEAGTRTGMFTMRWGANRIQEMLLETALQPEVVYMMITSKDGTILAHSDAQMVGKTYSGIPAFEKMADSPNLVFHRVQKGNGPAELFEVYKRFVPVRRQFLRGHMRRRHLVQEGMPANRADQSRDTPHKDWSHPYVQAQGNQMPEPPEHYIFAGLSMERALIDRDRLIKETVWRGVLFLIIGCAGMVALFAFQGYRAARASLSSIKAFSDHHTKYAVRPCDHQYGS